MSSKVVQKPLSPGSPGFGVAASAIDATPDPGAIREQLERILQSPVFRNSQRYTSFLKFCVERALDGQSDSLKERTIGVEVFGRALDYDTGSDHVVRSAAGEIRKRLAQYYQDPSAAGEIRIDLYPGSYVPQFRASPANGIAIADSAISEPVDEAAAPSRGRRWMLPCSAILATAAVLLTVFVLRRSAAPSALDRFWGPILASPTPVLLCVGDRTRPGDTPETNSSETTVGELYMNSHRVSFASATTLARLAGLLQSKGRPYRLMLRSATTFNDLQDGPSVLIGGYNNTWTLRLTDTLRFGFALESDGPPHIRDRQNPDRKDWSVDFFLPFRKAARDYAIVSRVLDPKTERTTVIVAGIGPWGTSAAGEFITDEVHLRKLEAHAPKGWQDMNLQVVLSADVIDGIAGPPKVVATHFW